MFQKLRTNPLVSLFIGEKKKNTLLAAAMLFCNLVAAMLEGLSFASLLSGFSVLNDPRLFMIFLLGAIGGQLMRSAFAYFGQIATTYLTVNMQTRAQQNIYGQIFRMTYTSASRYKVGDLIYHATAPSSFFPHVMDGINKMIVSGMMIGGYLIFMFSLSGVLTINVLALFILAALLQKVLIKKITAASNTQAEHTAWLNKETAQNLEGLKTVHLFDRGGHILNKVETTLQAIARSTYRLSKWHHLIVPVNEMIAVLLVGASLLLAFFFLQRGAAFIPFLVIYLSLTYRLGSRLQVAMSSWGSIAYHYGPLGRMGEILRTDDKEFLVSTGNTEAIFDESIVFDNVSFTYPEKSVASVHNISFAIPKGKMIALVGASGGGKSTLLTLLMRLYEPTEGGLLVDGVPLAEIEIGAWRSLFGVVNQDLFLFHESIEENIRFGKLNASLEEIKEAARLAGAHPFIEKLPFGYQTLIGEKGHRLSGGERQRISLARALIRKPDLLVLDEATSNLDSESERVIQEALNGLRGKTTIFIVAHRLSTTKNADEILVVDEGKIIERGNHKELLKRDSLYSHFWHLQTKAVPI